MKKLLLIVTIIALVFGVLPVTAFALNQTQNELNIAVDEPFYNLDIFGMTKHSSAVDNIFTMAYDRLFAFDNGNLVPDLALSCEIQTVDYALVSNTSSESFSFDWPEWPEEWLAAETIPGMLDDIQLDGDLEFLGGEGELVLEVTLRDNVRFSDGSEFTTQELQDLISAAKQRPQNTLIYKQWEAVNYTYVTSPTTIEFHMSLPENYGYIDFMYSLATPIASIVKLDGNDVIGTGAYSIVGCDENIANLERNENWWKGALSTSVDYVNFFYYSNSQDCLSHLQANEVSLSIASGSINSVSSAIGSGDLTLEKQIAGNPIALLMNKQDELLTNDFARQSIFWGIKANALIGDNFGLLGASHDYWTFDGHYYPGDINDDDDYLYKKQWILIDHAIDVSSQIPLSILCSNNEYDKKIANAISGQLEQSSQPEQRCYDVGIIAANESTYNSQIATGNYQLALKEIELTDIDSAYKYFYGQSTENMDNLLNAMKHSAKIYTFQVMQLLVQAERVNNKDLLIVGWKQKSLISNGQVENIKYTEKYNPISMVSYIDLRGIDFVTNP